MFLLVMSFLSSKWNNGWVMFGLVSYFSLLSLVQTFRGAGEVCELPPSAAPPADGHAAAVL